MFGEIFYHVMKKSGEGERCIVCLRERIALEKMQDEARVRVTVECLEQQIIILQEDLPGAREVKKRWSEEDLKIEGKENVHQENC